jgi:hypothetical protein
MIRRGSSNSVKDCWARALYKALALAGKLATLSHIKLTLPDNATAGDALAYMRGRGCPLESIDSVLGRRIAGANQFLRLDTGLYVSRLELKYVEADILEVTFHIIVYHVEGNGRRKLYDGDGSEMQIYAAEDHGKKRAHAALKKFIADPSEKSFSLKSAYPREIYKLG